MIIIRIYEEVYKALYKDNMKLIRNRGTIYET